MRKDTYRAGGQTHPMHVLVQTRMEEVRKNAKKKRPQRL